MQYGLLSSNNLTFFSTCCQQKSIKAAYHVICRPCAQTKHVCEKCLQPFTDDEKSTENIPFQELLETETSVSSECVELSEALSESSEAAQSDESVSASES